MIHGYDQVRCSKRKPLTFLDRIDDLGRSCDPISGEILRNVYRADDGVAKDDYNIPPMY